MEGDGKFWMLSYLLNRNDESQNSGCWEYQMVNIRIKKPK
jgi:hypothetical protein